MKTQDIGKLLLLSIGMILLVSTVSAGFNITPVCTNNAAQAYPAIYGDTIVWEDYRNGNYDIYMWDPVNGEQPVFIGPRDQRQPEIYGDTIIWTDIYDASSYIANNLGFSTPFAGGVGKAIWNDEVVYEYNSAWRSDNTGWDIYQYNLIGRTNTPLVTENGDQKWPAIAGSNIVLQYDGVATIEDHNIYGIIGGVPWIICSRPEDQRRPDVSENGIVVWEDNRNGDYDIYRWSKGETTPVCTAAGDQSCVAIDGTIVVWADKRDGDYDIYMMDLEDGFEYKVSDAAGDQVYPDVQGNTIVWMDRGAGNGDIWKAEITSGGTISLTSQPSGASVTLDGLEKGSTPLTISDIPPGTHSVAFSLSGYESHTATVTVEDGKTSSYTVTLTKERMPVEDTYLELTSDPSGASVSMDGIYKGVTPITIPEVDPGDHTLVFSLPGYRSRNATVSITANVGNSYRGVLEAEPTPEQTTPPPTTASPTQSAPGFIWICAVAAFLSLIILWRRMGK